jgi:hypothetical protein
MKLSEKYIEWFKEYMPKTEYYYLDLDYLDDLFEIVKLEDLMDCREKDQVWYECEEQLRHLAFKHDLPYD